MNVIKEFRGEYEFLSNFFEAQISITGWITPHVFFFPTNEHAFQAAKFAAMYHPTKAVDYVRSIEAADTPNEAKRLGRQVEIDVDRWNSIRVEYMRKVVYEKFRQRPNLRIGLLDTGHALLVEGNTWGDVFWGRCDGKGANILGSILMEVRGYYYWRDRSQDFRTPVDCSGPCVCTG